MPSTPFQLQALHAEHRKLAALGAHLLSDEHGGEDLAQEAAFRWVQSRRAPWRGSAGPGAGERFAWLRQTARRLASNERRGRHHRRDREADAARAEATPSTEEIAERAEICRRLHGAIEALPGEQADVLRDHYFGGLSSGEIAARDGLSVHTVKSRVQRARRSLRESLERTGLGGDVHWAVAILPVASLEWMGAAGTGGLTGLTSLGTGGLVAPATKAAGVSVGSLVLLGVVLSGTALLVAVQALSTKAAPGEDVEPLAKMQDQPAALGAQATTPAAEGGGRRLDLGSGTDESETSPVTAPETLSTSGEPLSVVSSAGVPLGRAYFQVNSGGRREPMSLLGDGRFLLPGPGEVSAPGHRPHAVLAGDASVELEAAGLLRVQYPGLRAGCQGVDGSLLDEAMLQETGYGFTSDDEFAIAVAADLWPNYNLRAAVRLSLRGGRTLEIEFLPEGDLREVAAALIEPDDLLGETGDLGILPSGGEGTLTGEFEASLSLQLPASVSISRQRIAGGYLMVSDFTRQRSETLGGPGPWQLPGLLLGRTYRLSVRGQDGSYGEACFEFDGGPLSLEMAAPTTLVATVRDDAGSPLSEVHVTALLPPIAGEGRGRSLWRSALGRGVTCELEQGRLELGMPYGSVASVDSGVLGMDPAGVTPAPKSVTFRVEAPGHGALTVPASWEAPGVHDLGEWVLPRRNDGVEWVGEAAAAPSAGSSLFWLDPVTGDTTFASIESAVPGAGGVSTLFMEEADLLMSPWPEELFAFGIGFRRARRVSDGRYEVQPSISQVVRFELDESLREGGAEVDLGVRTESFTQTIYTFYREAIGSTRSLDLVSPVDDASLVWRLKPENASPEQLGPWRELGPLASLHSVRLAPE